MQVRLCYIYVGYLSLTFSDFLHYSTSKLATCIYTSRILFTIHKKITTLLKDPFGISMYYPVKIRITIIIIITLLRYMYVVCTFSRSYELIFEIVRWVNGSWVTNTMGQVSHGSPMLTHGPLWITSIPKAKHRMASVDNINKIFIRDHFYIRILLLADLKFEIHFSPSRHFSMKFHLQCTSAEFSLLYYIGIVRNRKN